MIHSQEKCVESLVKADVSTSPLHIECTVAKEAKLSFMAEEAKWAVLAEEASPAFAAEEAKWVFMAGFERDHEEMKRSPVALVERMVHDSRAFIEASQEWQRIHCESGECMTGYSQLTGSSSENEDEKKEEPHVKKVKTAMKTTGPSASKRKQ
jgi:hypothetical protein